MSSHGERVTSRCNIGFHHDDQHVGGDGRGRANLSTIEANNLSTLITLDSNHRHERAPTETGAIHDGFLNRRTHEAEGLQTHDG
jgi:hypothetical protein